jgi:hypothetical protein
LEKKKILKKKREKEGTCGSTTGGGACVPFGTFGAFENGKRVGGEKKRGVRNVFKPEHFERQLPEVEQVNSTHLPKSVNVR